MSLEACVDDEEKARLARLEKYLPVYMEEYKYSEVHWTRDQIAARRLQDIDTSAGLLVKANEVAVPATLITLVSPAEPEKPKELVEPPLPRLGGRRKYRLLACGNDPMGAYYQVLHNHEYAASMGARGAFTLAEWLELCGVTKGCCFACGKRELMTIDHIHPLHLNGNNTISNIQPLCRSCNSRKGCRFYDCRPKEIREKYEYVEI